MLTSSQKVFFWGVGGVFRNFHSVYLSEVLFCGLEEEAYFDEEAAVAGVADDEGGTTHLPLGVRNSFVQIKHHLKKKVYKYIQHRRTIFFFFLFLPFETVLTLLIFSKRCSTSLLQTPFFLYNAFEFDLLVVIAP